MRSHSYWPVLALKPVMEQNSASTGTCQYLMSISSDENNLLHSSRFLSKPLRAGKGNCSPAVASLTRLKSMAGWYCPFFLGIRTNGEFHDERESAIKPCSFISAICWPTICWQSIRRNIDWRSARFACYSVPCESSCTESFFV